MGGGGAVDHLAGAYVEPAPLIATPAFDPGKDQPGTQVVAGPPFAAVLPALVTQEAVIALSPGSVETVTHDQGHYGVSHRKSVQIARQPRQCQNRVIMPPPHVWDTRQVGRRRSGR